jgi:hypothetical protein
MMKQKVTKTASFSLFFLLSGFALVHAQVPPPEPTEAPSRLSMFVDDFTNWLHHIGAEADRVDHHRASHSPPLPRPRLVAKPASAHVASNKEWSEFMPSPGASKKNTPTLVQIYD